MLGWGLRVAAQIECCLQCILGLWPWGLKTSMLVTFQELEAGKMYTGVWVPLYLATVTSFPAGEGGKSLAGARCLPSSVSPAGSLFSDPEHLLSQWEPSLRCHLRGHCA